MVKPNIDIFFFLNVIAVGSSTAFHERESVLKLMMCQVVFP